MYKIAIFHFHPRQEVNSHARRPHWHVIFPMSLQLCVIESWRHISNLRQNWDRESAKTRTTNEIKTKAGSNISHGPSSCRALAGSCCLNVRKILDLLNWQLKQAQPCLFFLSSFCWTVDGMWALWTQWSQCTLTCGQGIRMRVRFCSNPPPAGAGRFCDGEFENIEPCQDRVCPSMLKQSKEFKSFSDNLVHGLSG